MSAKDLLDSLIPEAYGRRPQGSAILPIGAVNLKTGRNQLFGDIWSVWEKDRGFNILFNRRDGVPIAVHTSGPSTPKPTPADDIVNELPDPDAGLNSVKKQYPVGSVTQFYHDQTMRQLEPGTVIDVFPHSDAGVAAIKAKTGKNSIKFYTFK